MPNIIIIDDIWDLQTSIESTILDIKSFIRDREVNKIIYRSVRYRQERDIEPRLESLYNYCFDKNIPVEVKQSGLNIPDGEITCDDLIFIITNRVTFNYRKLGIDGGTYYTCGYHVNHNNIFVSIL